MPEENKLFAMAIVKVHKVVLDENDNVECVEFYTQIVFMSGPTAEYCEAMYSEYLSPGQHIAGVEPVPNPANMKDLFESWRDFQWDPQILKATIQIRNQSRLSE